MTKLVKITEICDINIGRTPSRGNPNYWGKGHPWLSIADMNQGKSISSTKEQISDLAVKETGIRLVPENTVLYSFKLSIGKIGITSTPLYTNEAIASFPIKDDSIVDTNYLAYALAQIKIGSAADRAVMGKTLNKKKLAKFEIPIPFPENPEKSLKEQKRIAGILDKADELRKKRKEAIDLCDAFLKSTFLDMFGDPVTNPKGWEKRELSNAILKIQIGPFGSQLHKSDYLSGGIPLINPVNIIDKKIVPDFNLTISKEKFLELPNYHLEENDIIMGRRGEMGRCALVTNKEDGWFCGTGSLFLRPDLKKVDPIYLLYVLTSNSLVKYLENKSQGVTMMNLNKTILNTIPLQFPSLSLQNKFADIAKIAEETKQNMLRSSQELDNQFNALIQKAFKGEL